MEKRTKPWVCLSVGALGVVSLMAVTGCTAGDRVNPAASLEKASEVSVAPALKSLVDAGPLPLCRSEDLLPFDRIDGDIIDLDQENLPRGIYLARVSEMLVEKKNEGQSPSRILVREINSSQGSLAVAKGAEVICAENLERFGTDFESSLNGLVKFEVNDKSTASSAGGGSIFRQYYFFQDPTGYGVVISNTRRPLNLTAAASNAVGVGHQLNVHPLVEAKKLLQEGPSAPQIIRVSDHEYVLKYIRDREGARTTLMIHLDLIYVR